jgi:foldase protein PrsA
MQITDREIQEYYDTEWKGNKEGTRVELSHILVKCSEGNCTIKEKDMIRMANEITREWERGKSFPELASKYSEDVSASEGGYLGWFYLEDLRPEFSEAIQGIQSGKIVGPIRTDLGYHILFISERKTIGLEEGSPIWERIKETLVERKRKDSFENWIERLRKNATIEINNETL